MTRSKRGKLVNRLAMLMEANVRALKISGSDKEILEAYEAVIHFVRTEGDKLVPESITETRGKVDLPPNDYVAQLSIDEIEVLLDRQDLPRIQLEQIAIHRFGVPKGSMRNWGRKDDLREKALTMLRNERVHRTIGQVAKSKGPRSSD